MKDSKWDKIVLKNRNWLQASWLKRISWSDSETNKRRASRYDWEYDLRTTTKKIMMEAESLVQNSG
jgi:hypothetical protein